MKNEKIKFKLNKLRNKYLEVPEFDYVNIINQQLSDFYREYGEHVILGGDHEDFDIMLNSFIGYVEKDLKAYYE